MPFDSNNRWTGEKGIWKPAGDNLIIYDQLVCDPCSCTFVAAITAASNLTGYQLTDAQLKAGWAEFVKTGKFTPGFGAEMKYSCNFALSYFEQVTKICLFGTFVPFTPENAVEALKNGKAACYGINAGPEWIKDGQDNAVINTPQFSKGNVGHCVTLIKVNTMDEFNGKYLDNYRGMVYNGQPFKNVIQFKLPEAQVAFQKSLFVISK